MSSHIDMTISDSELTDVEIMDRRVLCQRCPVLEQCQEDAERLFREHRSLAGMQGGLSERDLRRRWRSERDVSRSWRRGA
jgi:hypothetical protein